MFEELTKAQTGVDFINPVDESNSLRFLYASGMSTGGVAIGDSLAICEVANERWLGGRGWPADPRARSAARSAACEMHSGFGALRGQMPMQCNRQPAERHWDEAAQRDIERVQALWRELRQSHGDGEGFLCGSFGIVDAMFAPVCVRFRGYGPVLDRNAQRYAVGLKRIG